MTIPTTQKIDDFMNARSSWKLGLSGFVLLMAVAALDYSAPREMALSIFYILPIMFVTWYVGARMAYIACIVAASAMILIDHSSSRWSGSIQWISYWNAGARLCLFVLVTWLITQVNSSLKHEEGLARKDALTGIKNSFAFKEEIELIVQYADRYKQVS